MEMISEVPGLAEARPVESRDPATGEVWRRYTPAPPEEVREVVSRAREAQKEWSERALDERADVLEKFRRRLFDERDEVARTIHRETGKPVAEALFEVIAGLDFARYYAKSSRRLLRPTSYRSSNLAMWRKKIRMFYEPYGVIGVISPWNYPFLLSSGAVLPALVGGNSVVLKPSEYTPTIGVLLGQLLHEAGVPRDVISVIPGAGPTGAALVHSAIDKIIFIGSESTGKKIAMACGERLIPYVLELGGSDPAIVLEDADVKNAAAGIAWGRFTNAGQTCVAPKRAFVVDGVYDSFISELKNAVDALGRGDDERSRDIGPLINPAQHKVLSSQFEDATARGAKIVARSTLRHESESFFPPTVLTDVAPESRVLHEETFGPLLPVIRVRDADEAIALANTTHYGLSASIWSSNVRRAIEVAKRIEAGTVTINDSVIVPSLSEVPHGGIKSSGMGRAHGEAGLMECVQTKTMIVDPWAGWRQVYWYGYNRRMVEGLEGFIGFSHGRNLAKRLLDGWRTLDRFYLRPKR